MRTASQLCRKSLKTIYGEAQSRAFSRLPLPVLRFFGMLCKPSSSTVAGEWCVENKH
jgi:hypothetical protein